MGILARLNAFGGQGLGMPGAPGIQPGQTPPMLGIQQQPGGPISPPGPAWAATTPQNDLQRQASMNPFGPAQQHDRGFQMPGYSDPYVSGGGGSSGLQQQAPQLPPWMASQGGAGLPPPQMPPGQGGMGALMGGFSTSPEFQNQLGAIHGGTSPGHMPVQFTPPQTPVPPMNVNTGNTRSGRSIAGVPISGPGGLRDGMGGYTGNAPSAGLHHDAFRYLRGL
jgi:hypothetical protein